jgi:hypothetical protein
MISVYNETKTAWGFDTINDSVLRLMKRKTRKDAETGKVVKNRAISIIAYTQIFGDLDTLRTRLNKIRMSEHPSALSYKPTTIVFNRKEFKPFISERETNQKHVLLGSLFLQGRKVVSVKNNDTFLLEYFIMGGEFSFIVSLNRPTANFVVELLDQKNNKLVTYKFFVDEAKNRITLEKTEQPVEEGKEYGDIRLRPFRPSRPTHLVFADVKDADLVGALLNGQHSVRYFDQTVSVEDLITAAQAENYKAVTLLYNPTNEEEQQKFDQVVSQLLDNFYTVYKMNKTGEIEKLAY